MAKILIIDHDCESHKDLLQELNEQGFSVLTASSSLDGLRELRNDPEIGCVLIEESMPKMSGVEFASHLKHDSDVPVILLANSTELRPDILFRTNISGVIHKPFNANEVVHFLKANQLHQERFELGKRKLLRTQALGQVLTVKMFTGTNHLEARIDNVSPGGMCVSFDDKQCSLRTVSFDLSLDAGRILHGSMHCRWQSCHGGRCLAGFEFDSLTKHDFFQDTTFHNLLRSA